MKFRVGFAAALVLLFGWFCAALAQAESREMTGWHMIEKGAVVIDVRRLDEYAQGYIEGAILIPHTDILAQFEKLKLDKDLPVVLYCRSGNRAGIALNQLKQAGYSQVFNAGGYLELLAVKAAQ